ncbi:hypothetical protein [Anaerolentibacter hominis]|uniref:hypothetical protein n=1 Tax=Anaerolentibacter hominis TaxID=3079009 RepID=UPI0031B84418
MTRKQKLLLLMQENDMLKRRIAENTGPDAEDLKASLQTMMNEYDELIGEVKRIKKELEDEQRETLLVMNECREIRRHLDQAQ